MKEFHSHGIHFEYPDGWRINQDIDGNRVVLTLTGPGTAFWMVSICRDRPDRELLMEEALGSFREDYLGCDIYDGKGEITCFRRWPKRSILFITTSLVRPRCVPARRMTQHCSCCLKPRTSKSPRSMKT